MLAKLIATADDREAAVQEADRRAGSRAAMAGIETNRAYLRQVLAYPDFAPAARPPACWHASLPPATMDVLEPACRARCRTGRAAGLLGCRRAALRADGRCRMRLANRLVGNAEGAAALELTATGPTLRFNCDTHDCPDRRRHAADAGRRALALWQAHPVKAGSVLALGAIRAPAARLSGGAGRLDVPDTWAANPPSPSASSAATAGARCAPATCCRVPAAAAPAPASRSALDRASCTSPSRMTGTIGVLYGPHGAPDFFTDADIDTFFATDWEVHYNSSRTGVRLIGPRPQWARKDGGEAGLHPSNIHDNAYAIGAVDFTGDMPVILGPDGPSLGGFVCPATIVRGRAVEDGPAAARATACASPVTPEQANAHATAQDAPSPPRCAGPQFPRAGKAQAPTPGLGSAPVLRHLATRRRKARPRDPPVRRRQPADRVWARWCWTWNCASASRR
jgi:urea carboxylase